MPEVIMAGWVSADRADVKCGKKPKWIDPVLVVVVDAATVREGRATLEKIVALMRNSGEGPVNWESSEVARLMRVFNVADARLAAAEGAA